MNQNGMFNVGFLFKTADRVASRDARDTRGPVRRGLRFIQLELNSRSHGMLFSVPWLPIPRTPVFHDTRLLECF